MKRKIIKIDKDKCNGCGLCVQACHESAIEMIDGKAQLVRDDYCDGLGDCLPVCPKNAITFEEREALPFDKAAVEARMAQTRTSETKKSFGGCPGSKVESLKSASTCECPPSPNIIRPSSSEILSTNTTASPATSELMQWPVQIKLLPVQAPYLDRANLLIAADCAAYAHGDFHNKYMKNRITIIGCPKLDAGDYKEKLTTILMNNNIKSVTIIRMEVPCCQGLAHAAIEALKECGKMIPWQVITLSVQGKEIDA